MSRQRQWFCLSVLALSLFAGHVRAETQYITDQLTVPLRRGPSNQHKIIHAGLPSGTALEILSEDKAAGFTQVRMQNGTDGWLPTQYLTPEAAARDRLTAALKRIESMTAELTNLRQNTKQEQGARANAEGNAVELSKTVRKLEGELAEIRRVSANSVAIYDENQALKAKTEALEETANDQSREIQSLKSHEWQYLLMVGGGLVVLGLIFGISLKSRPKRHDGW